MNHSKWNRNHYNNFNVEYYVNKQSDILNHSKVYRKAQESEVIWLVEDNTKIYLKFYYLLKTGSDSHIWKTEFQLNLEKLVTELPLRNSYDYEFTFGWQEGTKASKVGLVPNKYVLLKPIKRNGYNYASTIEGPSVDLKCIEEEKDYLINQHKIIWKCKLTE